MSIWTAIKFKTRWKLFYSFDAGKFKNCEQINIYVSLKTDAQKIVKTLNGVI